MNTLTNNIAKAKELYNTRINNIKNNSVTSADDKMQNAMWAQKELNDTIESLVNVVEVVAEFEWDFEECGDEMAKGGSFKIGESEVEMNGQSFAEVIQNHGVAKARQIAKKLAKKANAVFKETTVPGTAIDYRVAVLRVSRA